MTSVRRSLTFRVQRAGHAPITLRLMAHAAPAALAVVGDTLRFELPDGDHLYLVSKEDPRFPVPPAATALVASRPAPRCSGRGRTRSP